MEADEALPCLVGSVTEPGPRAPMGYNLYIIRSDAWATADEKPGRVTLAEWRRLANADPEFEPVKGGEHFNWRPSDWWFCYSPGRVWVKSPDDPTIGKMLRVAC